MVAKAGGSQSKRDRRFGTRDSRWIRQEIPRGPQLECVTDPEGTSHDSTHDEPRANLMAQRGREGVAKRAKERARQERQEAKRLRRQGAPDEAPGAEEDVAEAPDEMALMEEFRLLSERHAAGLVSEDLYAAERHRIFVDLGIESDEEA